MAENETNLSDGMTGTSAATETIQTADGTTGGANANQENAQESAPESTEEITYHAVERDGQVAAIWEMQGRKHLRTVDPRSRFGQEILRLYTSEHHDEAPAADAAAAQ